MTTSGIDFSTLSLQDALDLAILIEEEAKARYEEFIRQMELHHTAEAAAFFRHMAENEAKHGSELAERRARRFENAPRRVTAAMLWDVEAPEYEQARAFMSHRQALLVALESEKKARAFFADAVKHVKDPEVKKLFQELGEEEAVHERLVSAELSKLPPEPDVEQSDYADEPVAQ